MLTLKQKTPLKEEVPPLSAGDTLTWEEFERRWDATPEIKFAELIGGRVYMPSPLSFPHGKTDSLTNLWLAYYAGRTSGCDTGTNATCRILGDAPQPDVLLRIIESRGGQSRVRGKYLVGAPELTAEVCVSSAAYDVHEKKDLYEQAGVQEFVAVLLHEQEVRWHCLKRGKYALIKASTEGIIRSIVFPGLWLNVPALLKADTAALLATLEQGLATPEHAEFVKRLAQGRK
ncbi:MAG TPA: Uma2 family endonuclease [Planctomycetota bacterium]|jgi:Uma2 family endonuclease